MLKLAIISFILACSIVSIFTVGYKVGNYVATEELHKKAIGYYCGSIDRETIQFSWKLPSCVIEAEKEAEKSIKGNTIKNPPSLDVKGIKNVD